MAKCADTTVQTEADVLIGTPTKRIVTEDNIAAGMSIIITRMKDRGAYRINNTFINTSIPVSNPTYKNGFLYTMSKLRRKSKKIYHQILLSI